MNRPRPKYQVFISSTFEDLVKERQAAINTILRLGQIPVGMEMFNASNKTQWEMIKRRIEESDYYIVLIAHRYGSVDSSGISYTEKEYDYASTLSIPVLGFIFHGDKWETKFVDAGKKKTCLGKFKKKVKGRMADFFQSSDELSAKVATALSDQFVVYPGIGWTRTDQLPSNATLDEFAKVTRERDELRELVSKLDESHKLSEIQRLLDDYEPLSIVDEANNINIKYNVVKFLVSNYELLLTGEEVDTIINSYVDHLQSEGELNNYNFVKDFTDFISARLEKQVGKLFNFLVLRNVLEVYEVSRERADINGKFIRILRQDKTYEVKKYKLTQLGKILIGQNFN